MIYGNAAAACTSESATDNQVNATSQLVLLDRQQ